MAMGAFYWGMQGKGWRVKLSAAFFRRNLPKEPPAMISHLKRLRGTLNAANSARKITGLRQRRVPGVTPSVASGRRVRLRRGRSKTEGFVIHA